MGGSEDGRVTEGAEGGVGSEVSGTNGVCSEFDVACSCTKVGEEGSGISG